MKPGHVMLLLFLLWTTSMAQGQVQAPAQPASPPAAKPGDLSSPLNGNWHLTGVFAPPGESGAKMPSLSLAIEVDGDKLYGQGDVHGECGNSGGYGEGAILVGQIAADGTFELHFSPAFRHSMTFIVHGTVPATGATAWKGTYAVKNSPERVSCPFDQSGAFTATRYPHFTGSYSGAIKGSGSGGFGPGITVKIKTVQGEPGPDPRGGFDIPMDGEIAISGSPCSGTGTVSKKAISSIKGDEAGLTFKMDDGSVLSLAAFPFADPKKSTVWVNIQVAGGQCDRAHAQGVLARR